MQRLALEAYLNMEARAAAGSNPIMLAENREQERNRRVCEAFMNGMPLKPERFILTQPEDATIDDLRSKTGSRVIVDRLHLEDDDAALNEIRGASSKESFAGIEELTTAQNKF